MIDFLKSFGPLTEEDIAPLQEHISLKKYKKGEFFIKEGKVCQEVGFIQKGIFRSFYHSSSGEEITYCFTFQHSFITAYSSFISQAGTQENIEALTDVELLSIPKRIIDELESTNINWLRVLKKMAEEEYIKMEKRIFLLQKESAEIRYKDLLENHPEYLHHIPLTYLASYLGITQRHLSRIRSKIIK